MKAVRFSFYEIVEKTSTPTTKMSISFLGVGFGEFNTVDRYDVFYVLILWYVFNGLVL